MSLFDQILLDNKIKESKAATICCKLASILKYLHRFGIVIRDLRTEHVAVEGEGDNIDVKLVDLSMAV